MLPFRGYGLVRGSSAALRRGWRAAAARPRGRVVRVRRVPEQPGSGHARDLQGLVAQVQRAHVGVVHELHAAPVVGDVVRPPPARERLAALRELVDELLGGAARRPGHLHAEHGRDVVRDGVPVVEEPRRVVVEEHVARQVRLPLGVEHAAVQGAPQVVGGRDVQGTGLDDGGRVDDRVEQLLQGHGDANGRLPGGTRRRRSSREVEEVGALGVVEPQGPCDRGKHLVGDPAHLAALHLHVVVDAHPREGGDFFPAQSGNAAACAPRQSDVLGLQAFAPRHQELADLGRRSHGSQAIGGS